MNCRFCNSSSLHSFCDLGETPLANSYLKDVAHPEPVFPLHAFVCPQCFLVQLDQFETPESMFSHYAYFSSYSTTWLQHAKNYVDQATHLWHLNSEHLVVEIASNDGYLLQFFKERLVRILGIEPAENVARVAEEKGIPTLKKFFGAQLAQELAQTGRMADLIIANNVLAHVPQLNDFVEGLRILLKPGGRINIEFPHLLRLIEKNQFDTIYHEHFSYFSLLAVEKVFAHHGLTIYDVEELSTHGGSLRIYARHRMEGDKGTDRLNTLREREREFGLDQLQTYFSYGARVREVKQDLIDFLQKVKKLGKKIAGYGAPAKGNTLLNYCEISENLLPYTVDISRHKQGLLLPGSHIPIYPIEKIQEDKPDFLLVLPWNLRDEIVNQMSYIRQWGGKFIVPIPRLEVLA